MILNKCNIKKSICCHNNDGTFYYLCQCEKKFKSIYDLKKHCGILNNINEGKNKELINIDIDLISELRRNGRRADAERLLRAFRESVKKTKKETLNEFNKKNRLIKKFIGICSTNGCNRDAMPGRVICHICSKRNYKNKSKKKDDFLIIKEERMKTLKLNHVQLDIIKDALYWQMVQYINEGNNNSKRMAESYSKVLSDIKIQLNKQSLDKILG